jgi:hypothetical protein
VPALDVPAQAPGDLRPLALGRAAGIALDPDHLDAEFLRKLPDQVGQKDDAAGEHRHDHELVAVRDVVQVVADLTGELGNPPGDALTVNEDLVQIGVHGIGQDRRSFRVHAAKPGSRISLG